MMLHTRHAHVGKRSNNHGLFRYWAKQYKHAATKRERQQWREDMAREEMALLLSIEIEEREEEERLYALGWNDEEMLQRKHDEAHAREQFYLNRIPTGSRVWEQRANHAPQGQDPVYYALCEVVDHHPWTSAYMYTLATITLNRDSDAWVIDVFTGGRHETIHLPFWGTTLDQAQQYTCMMVRISATEENYE